MTLGEVQTSLMSNEKRIGRGEKLNLILYHAFLPENHVHFVSEEQVMQEGIHSTTKSNNRYSNGSKVKVEKIESLRPIDTPD